MRRAQQPLQSEVSIAVAPTTTVVLPATAVSGFDTMNFKRTNNDGSQVLNEQLEASHAGVPPWSVQQTPALQNIQPGETRIRTINVQGLEYVRTTATASGAGLNETASTTGYVE